MLIIFWLSFSFIFYAYVGYPLTLYILSQFWKKNIIKILNKKKYRVSVVIAAKNECNSIKNRIMNIFSQDYPHNKMEIIVVSDGSTDNTSSIVDKFASNDTIEMPRVISLAYEKSQGKPYALNLGVSNSTGEIIIFTDARQHFAEDAVSQLVANFEDPTVGAVSGELIFKINGKSSIKKEMGAYWNYEKFVRKLESYTGSAVGATGAIYAIRKKLFKELPSETLLDDVLTPINITLQKFRVIYDFDAKAYDFVSNDLKQEWVRKVRTLAGNWQLLSLNPYLLIPWRNALFFRLFWHKFARLLVPLFLMFLFISSAFNTGLIYQFIFIAQIVFYFFVLAAHVFPVLQNFKYVRFAYFFGVMNAAVVKGFFVWISDGCKNVWNK